MKKTKVAAVMGVLISFVLFLMFASPVPAANICSPAIGKFEATIVPCETNICTKGSLVGSPFGDYEYTGDSLFPAGDATVPTVMFYTGKSVVRTRKGDIYLTDTGALDMTTGRWSDLLTVTGGTGDYINAKGYLHAHGAVDFKAAASKGEFEGEICRPR